MASSFDREYRYGQYDNDVESYKKDWTKSPEKDWTERVGEEKIPELTWKDVIKIMLDNDQRGCVLEKKIKDSPCIPGFITVRQAAVKWDLSSSVVDYLCRSNLVPCWKFGDDYMILGTASKPKM